MTISLKTRLLAAATLVGASAGGTIAWADEQTTPSTVDDIVVTAQLREEKTIGVAFALTA